MQLSHWLFQEKLDWVAGEIDLFVDKLRARRLQPAGVNPRSPSADAVTAAIPAASP